MRLKLEEVASAAAMVGRAAVGVHDRGEQSMGGPVTGHEGHVILSEDLPASTYFPFPCAPST